MFTTLASEPTHELPYEPPPEPLGKSDALWVAVGTLSVAIMSFSTLLVYTQQHPGEPLRVLSQANTAALGQAAKLAQAKNPEKNHALQPAGHQPSTTKKEASPDTPLTPPSLNDEPTALAAAACQACGLVESVIAVQNTTSAGTLWNSPLANDKAPGMVALLGALERLSSSSSSTWDERALEKARPPEPAVYQVGVRMQDGSQRVLEVAQAPSVGSAVQLEGLGFRSRDGTLYTPPAAPQQASTQGEAGVGLAKR